MFDYNRKSDVSAYLSALSPQFPSSPDLSAYARRGGKLITWHGWGDSLTNPSVTLEFYEAGLRAMGGVERVKDFDRLFLVPGANHLPYGAGPINFDDLGALEQWVEKGIAPDFIIGENPFSNISRPICAYPQVAKLISPSADPSLASSFECVDADD